MRVSGKSSTVGATQGSGATKGLPRVALGGAVAAAQGVSEADAVTVSAGAHLMALAQAELAQVPDVRTDKVEALRARLDADAYHPDGEAVADGLIREHTPVRTGS